MILKLTDMTKNSTLALLTMRDEYAILEFLEREVPALLKGKSSYGHVTHFLIEVIQ